MKFLRIHRTAALYHFLKASFSVFPWAAHFLNFGKLRGVPACDYDRVTLLQEKHEPATVLWEHMKPCLSSHGYTTVNEEAKKGGVHLRFCSTERQT